MTIIVHQITLTSAGFYKIIRIGKQIPLKRIGRADIIPLDQFLIVGGSDEPGDIRPAFPGKDFSNLVDPLALGNRHRMGNRSGSGQLLDQSLRPLPGMQFKFTGLQPCGFSHNSDQYQKTGTPMNQFVFSEQFRNLP